MITVDWYGKNIYVPQEDLTPLGGVLYELDLNYFRLTLKDLEDDEIGMPFLDTHRHNPPVTIAGINIARVLEIINGYTVEFEDGQYAVNLTGANSNVAEVRVLNQVSVNPQNSAGLIGGGSISLEDKLDIADIILGRDWSEIGNIADRSTLNALRILRNRVYEENGVIIVKKEDDLTTAWTANVTTSENAEPITEINPV